MAVALLPSVRRSEWAFLDQQRQRF